MKLATYRTAAATRTGIVIGDTVFDTGFDGTMIELIARWEELRPGLEAKALAGGGVPLASVTLCAPVLRPGKIWAIGLNYADHIANRRWARPNSRSGSPKR